MIPYWFWLLGKLQMWFCVSPCAWPHLFSQWLMFMNCPGLIGQLCLIWTWVDMTSACSLVCSLIFVRQDFFFLVQGWIIDPLCGRCWRIIVMHIGSAALLVSYVSINGHNGTDSDLCHQVTWLSQVGCDGLNALVSQLSRRAFRKQTAVLKCLEQAAPCDYVQAIYTSINCFIMWPNKPFFLLRKMEILNFPLTWHCEITSVSAVWNTGS